LYPSILFFFVAMMGGTLSEAGVLGIVMTIIFYSLSHSPRRMSAAYIASMLLLTIGLDALASTAPLNWHTLFFESYQWMMIGAIVPILMYNGKRGHSAPWIKYAFYIIYPLHIWVLYLISLQWR
ncbi:conjugal transfer protein TraX, partial [Clostridium perfringens]|nr:conjugal transfer protein TraX [Clostridium perfringens]